MRTQIDAFQCSVAGIRYLDVVADHDIGTKPGNVGRDAFRKHRGIPEFGPALDRELIGRPVIAWRRYQASRQRMALDDAFYVTHHLLRESEVAGQHENAQVRITGQQPGAKQADES